MKTIGISIALTLLICLFSADTKAQYLQNPSFEGPLGMATIPPSWEGCGEGSTPDTQPEGTWGVNFPASDGKTYLGMVCRGTGGVLLPNCEGIQQKLSQKIMAKRCYSLSLDLAYSNTMIAGYGNPIKLKIYGGTVKCGMEELLWESGKIDHTQWEKYNININAGKDLDYLILKADYAASLPYFGNIIIDNLVFSDFYSKEVKLDTLVKRGEVIQLKASEGKSYQWSPSGNLSCSNCSNPKVVVKDSLTYAAKFLDPNGCLKEELFIIRSKEVEPEVPPTDGEVELFIPNVFTPNGDYVNDYFEIKGLTPKSKLKVVNRWGETIYTSSDYNNDWSGNSHPSGNYYYVFVYSKNGKTYNGWVSILK